jgi:hypothetical protein
VYFVLEMYFESETYKMLVLCVRLKILVDAALPCISDLPEVHEAGSSTDATKQRESDDELPRDL